MRRHRASSLLVTATLGVLALSACGTATAPGPGGSTQPSIPRSATTGPLRPVTDQAVAADGALECPATISDRQGMTVPQPPQGVDGNARLLPDRVPESLVVCRYPVMKIMATTPIEPPFARATRTVVPAADRAEVVELLTWAPRGDGSPRPCTQMAGDETAHLVGARYADAIVWVAALADANRCSGSTNGDFLSRAPLGVDLEGLFGPRPALPKPTQTCAMWSTGRLGDDETLAPEGDPIVTVCRTAVDGTQQPTVLTVDQSREAVAALRGMPTRPATGACEGGDGSTERDLRLVLTYAAGPGVVVNVSPRCTPAVMGGGLESASADALVSLVEQWSAPIPGPDPDGSVSSTDVSAPGASG